MANKVISITPTYYGRERGKINSGYDGQKLPINYSNQRYYFRIPLGNVDTSWANSFTVTATCNAITSVEGSQLVIRCGIDNSYRIMTFPARYSGDGTGAGQTSTQTADFTGIPGQQTSLILEFQLDSNVSVVGWLEAIYINLNIPYTVSSQVEPVDSPTSGTINISNDITFSAELQNTTSPPISVDLSILTSTFYWRSGRDGEFNAVPMTVNGVRATVTIAGGTFQPGITQWYAEATDQERNTSQTEIYELTSQRKTVESTPVYPIGVILDPSDSVTFQWQYSSTDGTPQSRAQIQTSTDNVTWNVLGTIEGSATSYTVENLGSMIGVIYWRVLSYNQSMVASDWSTAVSFIARAAPTVQDIQATAKPWATVIWQADDQQTYEIFVDGESLGSYFGAEKQFPLPDYLEDGVHTVGVRVMGSFSLWSQINETQITIANTQAAALTLTAETAVDTALTWEGGAGDFFIYRDGLMIAHTNAHSFTDRVALGTHEYQVIERLASGDYNASEAVTQTPAVPYQHIAALAGGDWIAILHTLKSQSEPSYQESQETAFNYLSGNDYQTASIGTHRTDIGQYSAVFLYTEEAENRAFLALRGKSVILKTADGEVMIGVLNAWERRPKSTREKKLYTAYTFSLQRIGWEDFIDDTA